MTGRIVKPYGPRDAKILWIGEAPGKVEEIEGKPFVGPTGYKARFAVRMAGFSDETDVRWLNTVWRNPGKFPVGKAGALLMKAWADEVDAEIEAFTGDVIIACGGVALRRLTGFTSIDDWHCSVLRRSDLPSTMVWHQTSREFISHPCAIKDNHVVIPVLHPAGIMNTKRREKLPLFMRGVEKAVLAASGSLRKYDYELIVEPPPVMLWDAFADAKEVYFDTEFEPENGRMYWIGMTCDGKVVYGMPWHPRYFSTIKEIMENPDSVKGAHNILADVRVLDQAGVQVKGEWYDTMIGQYCLMPGVEVGLSPTSRYMLDDVKHTKWMNKSDPVYNALDVLYGWHCKVAQGREAERRPVDPRPQMDARMKFIPVSGQMEERGMRVDKEAQSELISIKDSHIAELEEKILCAIMPYWDAMVRDKREELAAQTVAYENMRTVMMGICTNHVRYNGLRKPNKCEQCKEIYNTPQAEKLRKQYAAAQDRVSKLRGKFKKLEMEGFNYNSPDHQKWLLYSDEALHLPVQRHIKTGKLTSGADAIERLSKLKVVHAQPEKFVIVEMMKEAQACRKAKSTFLRVPVDSEGWAHPPVKVHGTTTGRCAGGADKTGEIEKVSTKYSFNGFNIPEEYRRMYIPPEGFVLVAADWKNQEGRVVAAVSGDKRYLQMFRDEDAGGVDVHSQTAALIYNIDPGDARKVKVKLKGSMHPARHGGKMARHGWTYSPTPVRMLMANYQMAMEDAKRVDDVLSEAHPRVLAYKKELIETVLGKWEVHGQSKARCVENGTRFIYNPWGWQLYMWGEGESKIDPRSGLKVAFPVQAGEAMAFMAQASGASMWTLCAPPLEERYPIFSGTYDSFTLVVPDSRKDVMEAAEFMTSVMEQPWDELNGVRFPIEIAWGRNLGKYNSETNPFGLRDLV